MSSIAIGPLPPIKLRVDQDGDVYRVVHEDSGKVLCSGDANAIKHWVDLGKVKTAPAVATSGAEAQGTAL